MGGRASEEISPQRKMKKKIKKNKYNGHAGKA